MEQEKEIKQCKICREEDEEQMITPCNCTGSVEYVHPKCYTQWVLEGNRKCKDCGASYYNIPEKEKKEIKMETTQTDKYIFNISPFAKKIYYSLPIVFIICTTVGILFRNLDFLMIFSITFFFGFVTFCFCCGSGFFLKYAIKMGAKGGDITFCFIVFSLGLCFGAVYYLYTTMYMGWYINVLFYLGFGFGCKIFFCDFEKIST